MESSLEESLVNQLGKVVSESDLLLENVRVFRAGKHSRVCVTVDLVDGPGGVNEEQLERVTRAVSDSLDLIDPIKGEYSLEVSTAGAERELTDKRLYRRSQGRRVNLTLSDKSEVTGTLDMVDEGGITVTTGTETRVFEWEQIVSGRRLV